MEIQRTIELIVEPCGDLLDTVTEYSKYKQDISATAFYGGNPLPAAELHKKVYRDIPTRLSSQMRCSAIRSVASAYVSADHRS